MFRNRIATLATTLVLTLGASCGTTSNVAPVSDSGAAAIAESHAIGHAELMHSTAKNETEVKSKKADPVVSTQKTAVMCFTPECDTPTPR